MSSCVNLPRWLGEHGPRLVPPVANKMLFSESHMKVMVVGGPNARSDFHIQAGEEFFLQLKGTLTLKVVERGHFKDVIVEAGESFLLPSYVPHSPQRSENSLGLVFERSHTNDEMDGMFWFKEVQAHGREADFGNIDYEEYFHCTDLGTQLKPIIERYHQFKDQETPLPVERLVYPDHDVLLKDVLPIDDILEAEANAAHPLNLCVVLLPLKTISIGTAETRSSATPGRDPVSSKPLRHPTISSSTKREEHRLTS